MQTGILLSCFQSRIIYPTALRRGRGCFGNRNRCFLFPKIYYLFHGSASRPWLLWNGDPCFLFPKINYQFYGSASVPFSETEFVFPVSKFFIYPTALRQVETYLVFLFFRCFRFQLINYLSHGSASGPFSETGIRVPCFQSFIIYSTPLRKVATYRGFCLSYSDFLPTLGKMLAKLGDFRFPKCGEMLGKRWEMLGNPHINPHIPESRAGKFSLGFF